MQTLVVEDEEEPAPVEEYDEEQEEEDNDYLVDYYDEEYDGAGNDSDGMFSQLWFDQASLLRWRRLVSSKTKLKICSFTLYLVYICNLL